MRARLLSHAGHEAMIELNAVALTGLTYAAAPASHGATIVNISSDVTIW